MPGRTPRFEEIDIDLGLDEPDDAASLRAKVAQRLGCEPEALPPLELKKRAIDARRGRVRFHLTLAPREADPPPLATPEPVDVDRHGRVVIVGDGPAGLFCAYELARHGIGCVVLD